MATFAPEIRDRIRNCGVAAVLVIDDVKHAVPLAKALLAGGVEGAATLQQVANPNNGLRLAEDLMCWINTLRR